MQAIDEAIDQFHSILRDVHFDDSELDRLKTRLLELSSQLGVQHSLAKTKHQLKELNFTKRRQSRIHKFFTVVYGGAKLPSSRDDSQWESLRSLDCETFLLIAATYTPVDVAKMSRTEFKYLVKVVPDYLDELPEKWMFRKEIQLAVAAHAELDGMLQFKKRYHELEYSNPSIQPTKRPRIIVDGDEARKRPRTGQNANDSTLSLNAPQDTFLEETVPSDERCRQSSIGKDATAGAETHTGLGIETAFELTPEVFEKIWKKLAHERENGEAQSIILTIPSEDRVGSILYSIPRRKAIMCGKEYNLRKLPLPTSA